MLTHLVCFKYKADTQESDKEAHRAGLRGLERLECVVELNVGGDVVRSARSYDTGLIVRFRDRAALDAYQTDARHIPVAQYGLTLCEHIVSVDFEK